MSYTAFFTTFLHRPAATHGVSWCTCELSCSENREFMLPLDQLQPLNKALDAKL